MKLLKKSIITLVLFFVFSFPGNAQGNFNKWVIGLNGSVVIFENSSPSEVFNSQFPKINISKYISNGFSLDGSATLNILGGKDALLGNKIIYNSLDAHVRYDFGLSNNNFVPYTAIGTSYILLQYPKKISFTSVNISGGGTFWVSEHWGFNAQLTYKYILKKHINMVNHLHFTTGLVYSFCPRIVFLSLWKRRNPRRLIKNRLYYAVPR